MGFNPNASYGRALLDGIRAQLPAGGNLHIVLNSSDSADPNYDIASQVFKADMSGRVRLWTSLEDCLSTGVVSNNNDIVALQGHTSHKVAAMLTVSQNRVHFIGLDSGGRRENQRCLISNTGAGAASDTAMVKITGTGCTFRNISFKNNWTHANNLYCVDDQSNNSLFKNCTIQNLGSAHLTNANAAALRLSGDGSEFEECSIGGDTLQSTVASGQVVLIKKATTAATRNLFKRCNFRAYTNKTTHAFVRVAADGDIDRTIVFEDCSFLNFVTGSDGAQMAVAIASASGLVSGLIMASYPRILGATKLATAAVGNAGVFLVGTTAQNGDGVVVQAS